MKIVDTIIKEPLGGAHHNPEEMAKTIKRAIKRNITSLSELSPEERIEKESLNIPQSVHSKKEKYNKCLG